MEMCCKKYVFGRTSADRCFYVKKGNSYFFHIKLETVSQFLHSCFPLAEVTSNVLARSSQYPEIIPFKIPFVPPKKVSFPEDNVKASWKYNLVPSLPLKKKILSILARDSLKIKIELFP